VLADEAQNLLLPRDPASGAIDRPTQFSAGMLLKYLLTSSSTSLLVALTGSSMATFMLEVGQALERLFSLWGLGRSLGCSVPFPRRLSAWVQRLGSGQRRSSTS
jgi:hypothetical protein